MELSVPCFFSFLRFLFCLCFLHHLAVSLHFASSMMQPLYHDDECSALLKFKQSFLFGKHYCSTDRISYYPKVESWKLEGGNSSSVDCCSWDGVKCDEETGHVIKLDLSSSCLYGPINSTTTLFQLVHLQWLSLAYNDFKFSEIPATINNLSRLSHLNLSSSFISGQIPPQLLDLRNLVSLDLSYNYVIMISGNETHYLELGEPSLQNLVEKLTNLKVLNLDSVNITSPIPHILANLSSLTYLSLQYCRLQGLFPTKIFQLPNLSVLKLNSNSNLTGYLPQFKRSSPLTVLAIGDCGFYGTIPSSLGNLTKLVHLDVSFNSFLGELPISIGNLASLKELDLRGCNFSSGQNSSSLLGNLTQLDYLDISHSHNKFSGQNSSSVSWISENTKLKFLYLSDLNLVGEIPLWLTNLTQLTYLDMSQNQLTGPIPSWLMNIDQLSFLHLQSNQLTKNIPSEISNLTQLVDLDLSSNSLQGPIPINIFQLKNLQRLNLRSNNLSGTVEFDMFLSQLKRLEILILSSNNLAVLTNNIVANTNSQKLISIGLCSCNLSNFPNFLRNQDLLRVLDLSSNNITGKIPKWFLNDSMSHLEYLNLSHNLFTEFDQYPNVLPQPLFTIDLRFNKLQGPLPVPSMHMSEYLVSNNKMTGEIPPLICKSKHLYVLDLSNNNLSGVLPQCLANFSDFLSILSLQSNNFHGSIPQNFMIGNNLKKIDLSNNQLQGRIPRSLVNCTNLKYLHLGNNQITDIFPSWLGTLQELKILILKSNRLHGEIKEPETNFEFPKLQVIDLSHNFFTGELPIKLFQSWNAMKVVNWSHLSYMQDEIQSTMYYVHVASNDISHYAYSMTINNKGIELNYGKISNMLNSIILSENKFEGEIPASIASLKGLNNLNLSHNNLEGHIPSCFGNLTTLESLDLSSNRMSGNIPQQLVDITSLEVFNVSYNLFTGLIPQGKQFNTFENSSFDGNPGLCGKPLLKNCEHSKLSKKEEEDSESPIFVFDWKIVLIGFASGLIVGVVLGQEFYTRKHEWLAKFFGMQNMKRKRGLKN